MRKFRIPRILAWYCFFLCVPFVSGDCYIPSTYIVGPSYARSLGDCGILTVHNIGQDAALPADTAANLAKNCRMSDRIIYVFTVRDVIFFGKPALYEKSGKFNDAVWQTMTAGHGQDYARTMAAFNNPSDARISQACHDLALLTHSENDLKFKDEFFTEFLRKYPWIVFVRGPFMKIPAFITDNRLLKLSAVDEALTSFIRENPGLPIIDLSDGWENNLIDSCHLDPQGEQLLTSKLTSLISEARGYQLADVGG